MDQPSPPRQDPAHPPSGWGNGSSALARGSDAFEIPARREIDVITGGGLTRRERRANMQEIGFTAGAAAGYPAFDTGSTAATKVAPAAGPPATARGDPEGNYGIVPPDDQDAAVPTIRQ